MAWIETRVPTCLVIAALILPLPHAVHAPSTAFPRIPAEDAGIKELRDFVKEHRLPVDVSGDGRSQEVKRRIYAGVVVALDIPEYRHIHEYRHAEEKPYSTTSNRENAFSAQSPGIPKRHNKEVPVHQHLQEQAAKAARLLALKRAGEIYGKGGHQDCPTSGWRSWEPCTTSCGGGACDHLICNCLSGLKS